MASAQLRVTSVGPQVTFQDGGRRGNLRFGVPASGPMDRLAHAAANLAIGNDPTGTAIEISAGGVAIECVSGSVTVSVTGGSFETDHDGAVDVSWHARTVRPGERLTIRAGAWGSWTYLAVAGRLDVPTWLGHTATHLMSGFGGGSVRVGHEIDILDARAEPERDGDIPIPDFARPTGIARVVLGPQHHRFEQHAIDALCSSPYVLTPAYDRMGVRLEGAPLALREALSIPSEPIVRGSIQVAGDGVPTVLLADHQTTGGYPKIATVISPDLDALTQMRPGDPVRFESVSPAEAVTITRARAPERAAYFARIAGPGRTLTHRLRATNLIGGVVDPPVI